MRQTIYTISIEGLNLHHVLAFFEREKIPLQNLVRSGEHKLSLTIKKADYLKFKKSQLSRAYKVVTLSVTGPEKLLSTFVRNIGLLIGIVFVAIMTINLTSSIHSVKIICPSHSCQNGESCIFTPENQAKVLQFLAENGVKKGLSMAAVPPSRDIEKLLTKNFTQLSGASLQRRGVNLYLTLIERQLPANLNTPDLVASRSGIVISVDVISGQPEVKVGDIVLEGQTLVSAENNAPVTASVVLRTFYHEITLYNDEQVSYQRTGRKTTKHSMEFELFNIKEKEPESPYKLYESQTKRQYVFYNLFVPLISQTTTYWELEEVVKIVPYSQVEASLKTKLAEETRATLSPLAEEKNITFAEYKEGSRTRLDCYIEAYLTEKK